MRTTKNFRVRAQHCVELDVCPSERFADQAERYCILRFSCRVFAGKPNPTTALPYDLDACGEGFLRPESKQLCKIDDGICLRVQTDLSSRSTYIVKQTRRQRNGTYGICALDATSYGNEFVRLNLKCKTPTVVTHDTFVSHARI